MPKRIRREEIGPHVLYRGDSLEILDEIEAESVDCVFADSPYSSGGAFRGDRTKNPNDKYSGWGGGKIPKSKASPFTFTGDNRDQRSFFAWSALWLAKAQAVAKPGALLFTCTDWRQLPTTSDALQAGGWVWQGVVVWDKGLARPQRARFRSHVEFVAFGTNGPQLYRPKLYPSCIVRQAPPNAAKRIHLTEKPVELAAHCLQLVKRGGRVLDPFAGSCSTAEACIRRGLRFIGIEKGRAEFDRGLARLEQLVAGVGAEGGRRPGRAAA